MPGLSRIHSRYAVGFYHRRRRTFIDRGLGAVGIAIAHEWLALRAGSEKVFERLALAYPAAHLYALSRTEGVHITTGDRGVSTSFLDTRLLRDRRAIALPVMPLAWLTFGTGRRSYETVITSTHAFGRYFRPAIRALHLNYCHTPMRYAWLPELDRRLRRGSRFVDAFAARGLQQLDRASLAWTDHIAVNSTVVARRVNDFYDRPATVIGPPVDVDYYSALGRTDRDDYLLAVSRFVPYKALSLAIRAAACSGSRLVIAGSGPTETDLRRLAAEIHPGGVRFVISPTDAALRDLYARAAALIFPAVEDFGLVPVEAQAAGTPVVAPGGRGTLDTVVHGSTGVLFQERDPVAVARAIRDVLSLGDVSVACRHNAARFSSTVFDRRFREWADWACRAERASEYAPPSPWRDYGVTADPCDGSSRRQS